MGRPIPIQLQSDPRIAVEGAPVARALGLEPAAFRTLLENHAIRLLCERGIGEDDGLYRATFYHGPRRARLVVDRDGRIVGDIESS